MPELAEKTPIYDVYVRMNGKEHGIQVGENLIYDDANAIIEQFHWNWPSRYGSSATTRVGDMLFVLNNVDYVEIRRARRRIEVEPGTHWSLSFPNYVDAFLEDLENEND